MKKLMLLVGLWLYAGLVWADQDPLIINSESALLPLYYSQEQTQEFSTVITQQSELVMEGVNLDSEPRIVILRFDDGKSYNYISRLNIERVVTPGPFTIYLPMFGLKTPNGRVFEWDSWNRMILFSDSSEPKVSAGLISINQGANYSSSSFGFDLGTPTSPVLAGMSQITIDYQGIAGDYLRARHFPSGNAITSDGIQGIETLVLPVPNGQWDVTLWFAMEGQWESLPRQNHQQISLQGELLYQHHLTPEQWLQSHYLTGQYQEAVLDGSVWQLFGDQRHKRTTVTTMVEDGQLRITLSGNTTHDNYLAGVFLSPSSLNGKDNQLLISALQKRFEQKWQVVNEPEQKAPQSKANYSLKQVYFDAKWQPELEPVVKTTPTIAVPDTQVIMDFAAKVNENLDNVAVNVSFFDQSGRSIEVPYQLRQGIWRYQRPLGASTLLLLNADELQTINTGKLLKLPAILSRRINLVVSVPKDYSGSKISGRIELKQEQTLIGADDFEIRVLNIELPQLRQSVGVYHERSPHWLWFNSLRAKGEATLKCDYRYMKQMGITALSPPLSTPVPIYAESTTTQINDTLLPYINDLNHYHHFFNNAAMDYTTIKRLSAYYAYRPELKRRHLLALVEAVNRQQLPMPMFAITDEIHELNPEQLSEFSATLGQLQAAMPGASFLGQLNKPQNRQLVPMLDVLLINYGFGVSRSAINGLQRRGKSVWMYNMNRQRLAAGFYLWQSGAEGYLQWHGRMPTGQPYSPVDGREADFQMFYPSLIGCAQVPDINASLLDIVQGIEDRRWINWLHKASGTSNKAKKLLHQLKRQIPSKWQDVEALDDHQVHLWRESITALAVQLHADKDQAQDKNKGK